MLLDTPVLCAPNIDTVGRWNEAVLEAVATPDDGMLVTVSNGRAHWAEDGDNPRSTAASALT